MPPLEEELHSQLRDIRSKMDQTGQNNDLSRMSGLLKEHQIPVLEAVRSDIRNLDWRD